MRRSTVVGVGRSQISGASDGIFPPLENILSGMVYQNEIREHDEFPVGLIDLSANNGSHIVSDLNSSAIPTKTYVQSVIDNERYLL